jgi:hypothetical protein
LGGTGELVALLETRGCSGTVNLASADFHVGGDSVATQPWSGFALLLKAWIGMR